MKTKEEILDECGVRIFGAQQARIFEAMENYAEQKLLQHGVSGKRPDLSTIYDIFTKHRYYQINDEKFIEMLKAACASGAVDTATCGVDDNGWHCQRGGSLGVDSECLRGCVLARNSCEG